MKNFILRGFKFFGIILGRTKKNIISRFLIDGLEAARIGYLNISFSFTRNGELNYLKKLKTFDIKTIFDVGANIGEWSLISGKLFPESKIYAFEISSGNWDLLTQKFEILSNVKLIKTGLSDTEGDVCLYNDGNFDFDPMATLHPPLNLKPEQNRYNSSVICSVTTGKKFMIDNGIKKIDLLKIDVEGHDLKVIKGFRELIRDVRCIQFEYGTFNMSSKDLLVDFYKYLSDFNFIIGRLFPHHVEFCEFSFPLDIIQGGNYIAINKNDLILKDLLSKF